MRGLASSTSRAPDRLNGSLAFRRGWLATSTPIDHDVAAAWHGLAVGRLHFRIHPALGWARADRGTTTVLVLGDPIDLASPKTGRERLARAILRRAERGLDEALRFVAYLGGRSTVVIRSGGSVTIVPDAVASIPTYWSQDGPVTTFGSYSHLVGEVSGADVNEGTKELMARAAAMKTRGTLYWPGIETPFVDVLPLLPNHVLTWDGTRVEHARFYPFSDTTLEVDVDRAYQTFRELFSTHVAALCALGPIGISLTGGLDSTATFHAARRHLGPDALTWTYYKFEAPNSAMEADLMAANALARSAGVAHQVVAVRAEADPEFERAYTRTHRHGAQFRALALAYRSQLPADLIELQSMVAEVGTGFYKRRSGQPDPARLSYLYSNTDFGRLPEVEAAMERFIEYAAFTPDRFGEVDFHDLFYWETRIGRWGTLRMQEVDLAHQLMLPFNARGIIEALQGPALADRVDKRALRRFVADSNNADRRTRR